MKKYTQETFIEKCKLIHGNKYDYSKTVFSGIKNKITVICPKHGEFTLTADKHINSKRGCPFCSRNLHTQETFIEACQLVHGNKYDYSKTIFRGIRNPITVICPKHGEFIQRASQLLPL